jgi:hypothetical protein
VAECISMIRERRGKSENNYVVSMASRGCDQLRHLSESTTAKSDLEGVELQQRATRGESWFEPRRGNSKAPHQPTWCGAFPNLGHRHLSDRRRAKHGVRTIEFQQLVRAQRERAVGSRSASVDARQDLSSASSAAAAWPRSTIVPPGPGQPQAKRGRHSPHARILFFERGTPTRIFQRHKLAPS